ncbi:hypothetical protein HUJ04_002071 [Dendroctonus ponderosae]|nr:hypothetical protein HUJ04_002071 [Dendroctonus ponderosae]
MAVVSTGFIIFDLCLIVGAAFLAVLIYFKHSYRYWKVKRVPYLEPTFPLGNDEYFFTKSATFAGEAKSWYDQLKAGGHKFGGVWSFSRKALVLVDPDYIRDVLTQDFHHFANRDIFVNEKFDPEGSHLFNVRNAHWKPLRQKLTPTFTSGKMRMMFESVMRCCDHLVDHLKECAETGENIDSRETLSCFTTDVIGSVAFGVDCNSFSKEESDFRKYGKLFFRPNLLDYIRLLFLKSFPDLARKLRLKLGNTRRTKFFSDMVKQTIDHRTQFKVTRPDFLQLLINMNLENDGKETLSFDQIVANTILFFVAGFDTSSTAMNFALFELARNPDLQEKARQEVLQVMARNDGKITYPGLQEMTYVKQVLDETHKVKLEGCHQNLPHFMRENRPINSFGKIDQKTPVQRHSSVCSVDVQLDNSSTFFDGFWIELAVPWGKEASAHIQSSTEEPTAVPTNPWLSVGSWRNRTSNGATPSSPKSAKENSIGGLLNADSVALTNRLDQLPFAP